MDYEGIKALLGKADERFPRLSHLWLDTGYRGEDKGADWVRKTLGWSVELVERPKKLVPEVVLMRWAAEWAKEGVAVDLRKLLPPKGYIFSYSLRSRILRSPLYFSTHSSMNSMIFRLGGESIHLSPSAARWVACVAALRNRPTTARSSSEKPASTPLISSM